MSKTMKAYRWHGRGTPLKLFPDTPVPTPGPGQVLISVQACGLCHSDCDFLNGSNADAIPLIPITLGHEIAGDIIAFGPGVDAAQWPAHQRRVAISLGGHPTRLPGQVVGLEMDGGYADFIVAPAACLVPIPDGVSYAAGAVAVDCFTSAYHAVHAPGAGAVQPGMKVAVVGLGGLGTAAVRLAFLQGAEVWGVDNNERKFEAALESGAKACFTELGKVDEGLVFDVVLDFVGKSSTLNAAVTAVKYCGTVVMVGLMEADVTFKLFDIIFNNVQLRGSLGGSIEDVHNVMKLMGSGQLKAQLEEIPFDSLPQSLDRLEQGDTLGRLFTRPQANSK